MEDLAFLLVFMGLIILVVWILINDYIARQFEEVAQAKGYNNRKYYWICFWLGLVGYLLVIALPSKINTAPRTNTFIDSSDNAPSFDSKDPDITAEVEDNYVQNNNTVILGKYRQSNDPAASTENIEWLVLDSSDDKALVISKYALENQPYHNVDDDTTWAACSLREWLNNEFLTTAFSDKEKQRILSFDLTTEKNPTYFTDGGEPTSDKVFLLSAAELEKYMSNKALRKCTPTAYATVKGVYAHSVDSTCKWRLRTPGSTPVSTAHVFFDGEPDYIGTKVNYKNIGIRPAMWIKL